LESSIERWKDLKARADSRLPRWRKLERMIAHAAGLPVMTEIVPEVEAVRSDRSLLADTDYTLPLRKKLETALREELTRAHASCEAICERESDALAVSEDWRRLEKSQQVEIAKANRIELID